MPGDPFYRSVAWREVRLRALQRDRYVCTTPGCSRRASHVDHIKARRAGGADLDLGNLTSLCHGCHSSKTARKDGAFGHAPTRQRAVDVSGWPVDG